MEDRVQKEMILKQLFMEDLHNLKCRILRQQWTVHRLALLKELPVQTD